MDRNLLPAIAAFAEIAREGNFTRAAAKLGISPSGLSQTIKALEDKLGIRLLNRSTRFVSATEEGRVLLTQIDPSLAAIEHAIGALQDTRNRPTGEVRINSSRIAASYLLLPHLAEFHRRYPEIRLEIVIEDEFGDIIREGCDAGVRLREDVGDGMIAVSLCPPISLAVIGSPAYFAVNPAPEKPSDLADHNCLGLRLGMGNTIAGWELTNPEDGQSAILHPQGSFIVNNDDMVLDAALQGAGLAMHMDFAVRRHVDSGALIRVLEDWCPPFDGFNLYLPSREQMAPKLRAVVDFLVERRRQLLQ
ncbi:LysR family transcriptional regulator [Pseudochrobactrum sp. Wa41.01b-1]|uniref:LysR family transcriptional regulator n=1 Tax=Pseudochrobactrum sp. Wa41.01b-1 TaxID=2864102 RepID=UPI001C68C589|nr:LysR family transcriptional regulator [Pseudochrobactrum sp. Wa41.01b-1]QYM71724.1 LysR family transcriptional regulator [Pseudochrobactrum sp. Wa41.01b-1]